MEVEEEVDLPNQDPSGKWENDYKVCTNNNKKKPENRKKKKIEFGENLQQN